MGKNKNKDMGNWKEIANRLRNHEEPYKEGAWENFRSNYLDPSDSLLPVLDKPVVLVNPPRKIRRIWYSGVAAAAVLLFGLIWLWPVTAPQEDAFLPELVRTDGISPTQPEPAIVSTVPADTRVLSLPMMQVAVAESSDLGVPSEILPPTGVLEHNITFAMMESIKINPEQALQQPELLLTKIEKSVVENPRSSSEMVKANNGLLSSFFGDLNKDLSANNAVNENRTILGNKWALGLSMASMMTSSEEMNLGGGISVAYQLSDRLFVRSGVSLARLGVSTPALGRKDPSNYAGYSNLSNGSVGNPGPSGPQGPSGSGSRAESIAPVSPDAVPGYYTRLLSGASSNLLTVDVPLDVKYFVSNKFFAAVGVSFLGILNENRTNHYIENINTPLFNGFSANGQDLQVAVKTLHVNEATRYQPLAGNSYAGYLNFSVGRQSRISNRINLSIEPFFKLPVGKLMREEMNMTNGGIRIVTGF